MAWIESPIEKRIYEWIKAFDNPEEGLYFRVIPQHVILRYRVDFCIFGSFIRKTGDIGTLKVVIECDGHDFHEKTKEQVARDKKRDRDLQHLGFCVLRFSGSEIFKSPRACFEEIAIQVAQILKED